MSPAALANFIDYTVPDYDFSVDNSLYDFLPPQQSFVATPIYTAPQIQLPTVVIPVASTKTIAFTVADASETLPGANITIDGIGKAQTNANGYVVVPNVLPTSMVKISYVGYEDYVVQASQLPAKVIMKTTALQLPEVVIPNNFKKPVSNNWMWWLVGAVGAVGIYKYSKTGSKVVKAKI